MCSRDSVASQKRHVISARRDCPGALLTASGPPAEECNMLVMIIAEADVGANGGRLALGDRAAPGSSETW
jgi:hypothetical protein